MRYWKPANTKSHIWFISGLITISVTVGFTAFFMLRRSGPIILTGEVDSNNNSSIIGKFGTVTESLGRGIFTMSYGSITGSKDDLQLQNVTSRLQEYQTTWTMSFPSAVKVGGVWTLFGPLDLESVSLNGKSIIGKGSIDSRGSVLRWDKGIWYGLGPMIWRDLSGKGRGQWILPAGWYRDLNGRFIIENGPVRWIASKSGDVISMSANSMSVDAAFQEGHMEDVAVVLCGGDIKAKVVEIEKNYIHWPNNISFIRDDGWHGSSVGGRAPRSSNNKNVEKIELNTFQAKRDAIGGVELVNADHALWTKSGLILEGNVYLEQSLAGKRISLQATKIFQRNSLGGDFPLNMPVDAIWAGPQAILIWDVKSLISSHHIEGIKKTSQWSISAPAQGKWDKITFTAGDGRGNPIRWAFDGPILVNLGDGFIAKSDSLVWESSTFTLLGRPVSLTRFRERLTGQRILLNKKNLEFPDGIFGTLVTIDEDINIRADHGKILQTQISLDGRVECSGRDWRLQADCISVTLGAENIVKKIHGSGAVLLSGRMGEGRGDAISLDLNERTADWFGKVKAVVGANL
jgi:hypothetical protein